MEKKTLKEETMTAYGGECVDCCSIDVRNLQLDHVKDNGARHRRLLLSDNRRSGAAFYRALRKQGFRQFEEFPMEVVCRGCHSVRTAARYRARKERMVREIRERRRKASRLARAKLKAWAKRHGKL